MLLCGVQPHHGLSWSTVTGQAPGFACMSRMSRHWTTGPDAQGLRAGPAPTNRDIAPAPAIATATRRGLPSAVEHPRWHPHRSARPSRDRPVQFGGRCRGPFGVKCPAESASCREPSRLTGPSRPRMQSHIRRPGFTREKRRPSR